MDWFFRLEPNVQVTLIVAAACVVIVLVANLRIVLQRPSNLTYHVTNTGGGDTEFDKAWNEMTTDMFKNPLGVVPPRGFKVARHYIRRDDGMYLTLTGKQRDNKPVIEWVPRAKATHWQNIKDAQKAVYELGVSPHTVRVVCEEVEA